MSAPETAPPTSGGIPVVTDAMRLVRVLFSPGAVFEELKPRPTFWMPWLIVTVLFTGVAFLAAPYTVRVQELAAAAAGTAAPPAAAITIGTLVVTPIIVLVMSVLAAAILYALISVLGGESTFKASLSVVIHSWPTAIIQQALTVVVLSIRGIDSIRTPADAQVSLGLDLLMPAEMMENVFLRTMLAGIGPIQIWGIAITAVGVSVLASMETSKGWTAAIIQYGIALTIGAGLAAALGGMGG